MKHFRKPLLGLAVSILGAAAYLLSPAAAVLLSALGVAIAIYGGLNYNVPGTRMLIVLAALVHAAIVQTSSESLWLAAAVLPVSLAAPGRPWAVRRMGYGAVVLVPLSVVASVVLTLLDWPPRTQWWVVAPMLVLGLHFSKLVAGSTRRLSAQARSAWNIAVGSKVPEIDLPKRGGGRLKLSELRGQFVFLHFMRGDWCPLCQVMMRVLRNAMKSLEEHHIKLVVISHNEGPEAEEFARGMGLDFAIGIDPGHESAKRFGAFDPTAYAGKGSALPVGFLIGPDGTLRYASKPEHVTQFLDPDEVIRIVKGG